MSGRNHLPHNTASHGRRSKFWTTSMSQTYILHSEIFIIMNKGQSNLMQVYPSSLHKGLKNYYNEQGLTLWIWKVRMQYVDSSWTSVMVTVMAPYVSVPLVGQYWSHLMRVLSSNFVIITIVAERNSQHMRQKSANVSWRGPWKTTTLNYISYFSFGIFKFFVFLDKRHK
jgi:hypothetical protein